MMPRAIYRLISFVWLLLAAQALPAQQPGCPEYDEYKRAAESALREPNYVLAVQKYLNAQYCDPARAKQDTLGKIVSSLFDRIDALEKKSKDDADKSVKLTQAIRRQQDSTLVLLKTAYVNEAYSQLKKYGSPDYRIAFLLALEALRFDSAYAPALRLSDSLYRFCPMNINPDQAPLRLLLDTLPASERDSVMWFVQQTGIPADELVSFSELKRYPGLYYILARKEKEPYTWLANPGKQQIICGAPLYNTLYPANDVDWLIFMDARQPGGQSPYQVVSLRAQKVVFTGPSVREAFLFQGKNGIMPCWAEYGPEQVRVFSLPDAKLIDSCAYGFFSRQEYADSLTLLLTVQGSLKNEMMPQLISEAYKYWSTYEQYNQPLSITCSLYDKNGLRYIRTGSLDWTMSTTSLSEPLSVDFDDPPPPSGYFSPETYDSKYFAYAISQDSTRSLILAIPGLDTVLYRSNSQLEANRTYQPEIEDTGNVYVVNERLTNGQMRITLVPKCHSGKPALIRENAYFASPLVRNSAGNPFWHIAYQTYPENGEFSPEKEGQRVDELYRLENGVFQLLGVWENMVVENKRVLICTNTEKTAVFQIIQSPEGQVSLKPSFEAPGKYVGSEFNFFSYYYKKEKDKEVRYRLLTRDTSGTYTFTAMDSTYHKLYSFLFAPDMNDDYFSPDKYFIYKNIPTDFGNIKTREARPLADLKQRFFILADQHPQTAGDATLYACYDSVLDHSYITIARMQNGRALFDTVHYNTRFEVYKKKKEWLLLFDLEGTLYEYLLFKRKKPLRKWAAVLDWGLNYPALVVKQQNPDQRNSVVRVRHIETGQEKQYPGNTMFSPWNNRIDSSASTRPYWILKIPQADSVRIEIMDALRCETKRPFVKHTTEYSFNLQFAGSSDTLIQFAERITPVPYGLYRLEVYQLPEFERVVGLDSIQSLSVVRLNERYVESIYPSPLTLIGADLTRKSSGMVFQTRDNNVYHLSYTPYSFRLLLNEVTSSDLSNLVHNNLLALSTPDSIVIFRVGENVQPYFRLALPGNDLKLSNLAARNNAMLFTLQNAEGKQTYLYYIPETKEQVLFENAKFWRGSITSGELSIKNEPDVYKTQYLVDSSGHLSGGYASHENATSNGGVYELYTNEGKKYLAGLQPDTFSGRFTCELNRQINDDESGYSFHYQLEKTIPNIVEAVPLKTSDGFLKFRVDDPRGNVCLCQIDSISENGCRWYRLPLSNIPLSRTIRVGADLLLAVDPERADKNTTRVEVYSLRLGKKLRDIFIPASDDSGELPGPWSLSRDSQWLQFGEYYNEARKYFLGSRQAFERTMHQNFYFNDAEAEQYGVEKLRE